METKKYQMSCTEGLMGDFLYNGYKFYPLYNKEYYKEYYHSFFKKYYGINLTEICPDIFDIDLISKA